ncbi:MAG: 1-(5-phosphoribosyl)-5-[(5-phosphoribosylamino)methylideneamino]imidazole-4-carboxamide isomerase [Deinococcales bacterium]
MVQIIPCVDIQRGRAVRLYKGDPKLETVYFDSPLEAAAHWAKKAALLHLVDLDAAVGTGENRGIILEAAKQYHIEVGGGIRSLGVARLLLEGGVKRVVIGTAAVSDPAFLEAALLEFGAERVVVSLDAKDGVVALKGWLESSGLEATEVAKKVWAAGVRTLIYTDISRDGTLEGFNPVPLAPVREVWKGELIAGGGVRDERDIAVLATLGVEGVIVGRAIYEGTLTLSRAF